MGSTTLKIKDINWLINNNSTTIDCVVKLRSMHAGQRARITVQDNNTASVLLAENYDAITPGQACVMYEGERVLGGGWITRDES